MAVKLNELEETGTRWKAPSEDYPQGSFINGTGKGKRDGSYAKAEWANDLFGAHAAILKNGGETPNGQVETANNSQVYNALKKIIKNDIDTLGGDPSAVASGTVNAITATFTKLVALDGGKLVKVRAIGANTSPTVTFNPNGLGAKPVVKGNDAPLAVGDIAGAGYWLTMIYDATLQKWVLQNPATGVTLVLPEASESTKGIVQLATQSEVTNGTDATKAVSPKYLKTELDKKATNEDVALKAPLNNPTFTGSVVVPTPSSSNQAATKGYVDGKILSVNAYVVKTYHSGKSWYRVWSDGFVEQGGFTDSPYGQATTVTLIKPLTTTDYTILLSCVGGSESAVRVQSESQTTTSFQTVRYYTGNGRGSGSLYWEALGY